MKERPILMNGAMVRAILDGCKTQTRRVVKPQPDEFMKQGDGGSLVWVHDSDERFMNFDTGVCPHGQPGDRLWVREAWAARLDQDHLSPSQLKAGQSVGYWADGPGKCCNTGCAGGAGKKRPSIHMPRWASRILLEIVSVRVERLQDISRIDAAAEGMCYLAETEYDGRIKGGQLDGVKAIQRHRFPEENFGTFWESINGHGSWDANPWLWVIDFRRIKP